MGAGWNEMESGAYGIPLGTLTERSDRLEEGLEVIVALLRDDVTNHHGRFFELTEARCEPKPVQAKVPIVVGGKGKRRTLRTAARLADQWDMTFPSSPADWSELDAVLRAHCDDVGRDQSEIRRSVHLGFDEDRSPAAHAEEAAGFFAAGVDIVVWSMRGAIDPARLEPLADALTG